MRQITRLGVALAVPVVVLAGCAKGNPTNQVSTGAPGAGNGNATCTYPASPPAARTVDPPATSNVADQGTSTVTMTLDGQPLVLTLDRKGAPCTVNSFESLAKQGFFTDSQCWRMVDRGIFVLQCGDPSMTGNGGPGYSFPDELTTAKALPSAGQGAAVTYPKGTLAMANAGADTNGSQFFIVYEDSPLEPKYTVFGRVDDKGLEQVQRVAAQGVAADGHTPNAPAKITTVTLG